MALGFFVGVCSLAALILSTCWKDLKRFHEFQESERDREFRDQIKLAVREYVSESR